MSDKPLHVQVAEALGLKCAPCSTDGGCPEWTIAEVPNNWDSSLGNCPFDHVERFDTDWSATGPLIEKYRIWLEPCFCEKSNHGHRDNSHWIAVSDSDNTHTQMVGERALIAVCNLILALKATGKLKETINA